MKSNLLLEMQRIAGGKTVNKDYPMPCYLFIQKYGRNIQSELEEIARLFGRDRHFVFQTDVSMKEETLLRKFVLEEDKHAELGKRYSGCVLIELTGEEPEKELFSFLDYLDRQQERIDYLFTTKNHQKTTEIRKALEQFFFVRVLEGTKYEVQEQLAILEKGMEGYRFEMTEDAREEITEYFAGKEWKEEDLVEKRIRNLVSNIVYSRMLGKAEENSVIDREDVALALKNVMDHSEKKATIGFVIGG